MRKDKKSIARLHYLTQDDVPGMSHADLTEAACRASVRWVQFRSKKDADEVMLDEAKRCKTICDKYGAVLIVNDHVNIAAALNCGVHLGQGDMPVREAREILGDDVIIGGTANTEADIEKLIEEGADYIGLGPFSFTETKKNLSPVIPRSHLAELLSKFRSNPIVVIGGILPEDVEDILAMGAHGVAVSSAINMHPDKEKQVERFLTEIEMQYV